MNKLRNNIIILFLFSISFAASQSSQQFILNGKTGFIKTNVKVKKGEQLIVSGEGNISLGSISLGSSNPGGGMRADSPSDEKLKLEKSFRLGVLLMKIGDSPFIYVGPSYNSKALYSGEIVFYLNHNNCNNNKGYYKILLSTNNSDIATEQSANNNSNTQGTHSSGFIVNEKVYIKNYGRCVEAKISSFYQDGRIGVITAVNASPSNTHLILKSDEVSKLPDCGLITSEGYKIGEILNYLHYGKSIKVQIISIPNTNLVTVLTKDGKNTTLCLKSKDLFR